MAALDIEQLVLSSRMHLVPFGNTNAGTLWSEHTIEFVGIVVPLTTVVVADPEVTVTVLVDVTHLPPQLGCTIPHRFFIS